MRKDKYELAKEAAELRLLLGLDAHSPIDVFKLMDNIKNIMETIYFTEDVRISSISVKNGDCFTIGINKNLNEEEQGFSIVHQLYNMYFGGNEDTYIRYKDLDDDVDLFASFFLASPAALSCELKKYGELDDNNIEDICKYFGFSKEKLINRLKIEDTKFVA